MKVVISNNIVDLARYQTSGNTASKPVTISTRICRHCKAALSEGEYEDECSSAFNIDPSSLRWQAAQIS